MASRRARPIPDPAAAVRSRSARAALSLYSVSCASSHASQSAVHCACAASICAEENGNVVPAASSSRANSLGNSRRAVLAIGCQTRNARGSCCALTRAGAKSARSAASRSLFAPPPRDARTSTPMRHPAQTMAAATINAVSIGTVNNPQPIEEASPSVLQRGVHPLAGQLRAAVQGDQFDQERQGVNRAADLADQFSGGAGGAAGRQQIVDDQHALPFPDGVLVHFQRVGAV